MKDNRLVWDFMVTVIGEKNIETKISAMENLT